MDLSKDQADDIVRNKQNPQYQRYHDGDKAINESVSRAYLKQIPGEIDTSDKTPAALRTPPEKAGASEVAGPEAASEVETLLKAELGANFDATINDALAGVGQFFETTAEFETALNQLNLTTQQQSEAIKLLAKIGGKGR